MTHKLPELPYALNALDPYIDEKTMVIHHAKHHHGYVTKLNEALKGTEYENDSIETLLKKAKALPEVIKTSVINHGGGHANHCLFWTLLSPNGGGEPTGDVIAAINETFGSVKNFKETFETAAMSRFGSGWAWLVYCKGELMITSTPNQNSPLMDDMVPLIGIDLWEHAYYLTYQNRKLEYINAFWHVINWEVVEERYQEAVKNHPFG